MSKGTKRTVDVIETGNLLPNRDYYVPDLNLSIQATSLERADTKIQEIRAEKRRLAELRAAEAKTAEDTAE